MCENIHTFKFSKPNREVIETPIKIPFKNSVVELANTIIIENSIPTSYEKQLMNELSMFIKVQQIAYYDKSELIERVKNNEIDIDEVTGRWERVLREEHAACGDRRCAADEELFAAAYHQLVHSRVMETLLWLEHASAQRVRALSAGRARAVHALAERQAAAMNAAVDRLGRDTDEARINALVARQYEDHLLLKVRLTSELDALKEGQRRAFREWLMGVYERFMAVSELTEECDRHFTDFGSSLPEMDIPKEEKEERTDEKREVAVPVLEESFTIHLGSQMKQMHNIRILSTNVMSLCAVEDGGESEPKPQLLQTALALYSNDLSGLVLMTDNKIGSRLMHDFQDVCEQTTEFHFSNIDDQLKKVSLTVQNYLKLLTDSSNRNLNSELLQPGDFYITRHSNLAQVHVVFHMVSDDCLRGNEINSRHPVVLGLRNILKTACSNDITSLTIPLLLQYEMTEEMTIPWCEKRAELVFKCVKGFMIEMASWGGSDLKNLQFMLPQGISSKVFQSLTEMLPRIFKVSNPKILI